MLGAGECFFRSMAFSVAADSLPVGFLHSSSTGTVDGLTYRLLLSCCAALVCAM